MRTRDVARAGVTGAAALALAIVALQALQQAIGAFNPREWVSVLIVVAVVLATLAGERLRVRKADQSEAERQRDLLTGALRCPAAPIEGADPGDLGVFPPRRGDRPAAEYAPRLVDDQLRAALAGPLVLVYGDARSGKSRTAVEASRAALAGTWVIVPSDADGLRTLLDENPDLDCTRLDPECDADRVVLWLDGLERFSGALDGPRLDAFRATHERREAGDPSRPAVTVVATIRESTWDALLAADGEPGEFAKAVAARARAFRVPSELDPEHEAPRARELYPVDDLSPGIGAALAATGKQGEPPVLLPADVETAPPATGLASTWRSRLGGVWEDKLLLAPLAGCLIAVAAVCVIGLASSISKPVPPTIAQQADEITSEGNAGERTSAGRAIERVDFHGSGSESFVFGFRDEVPSYDDETSRADELRVYDVVGERLVGRFRFEPKNPAVYQFRGIADVDDDGAEELIGAFGSLAKPGELLVPFALDWDEDRDRYRLLSIHSSPPQLGIPADSSKAEDLQAPYQQLTRYGNTVGEGSVSGYPVQDFALSETASRMIGGYYVSDPATESPTVVEIQAEIFNTQSRGLRLTPCEFADDLHPRVEEQSGRLLNSTLADRWEELSQDRYCDPGA